MSTMTMRQRMLAVLKGRPMDRVPFVQYYGLAAPNEKVWSVVGRGNMGILRWVRVHDLEQPTCRVETEEIERAGRNGVRTVLHTPAGSLTQVKLYEPAYGSPNTREHFVKDPADYEALLAYLRDTVVVEHIERFREAEEALGEDGLPLVALERTPFSQMWIPWVSIEHLSYHLADCPEIVHECMDEMAEIVRRIVPIVRKAGVDMVDFPDNITTPIVSPAAYRRYCLPLYSEVSGILSEDDIPVLVHMDGNLRPLWDLIGESGIRGIDSLAPPPDNDTPLRKAAAMWPEMRLWPNFPSSVHLQPPEKVYERAMRMLEGAGHTGRLQIQISENVPRDAWPKSFPQIVQAIEDFGPPGGV